MQLSAALRLSFINYPDHPLRSFLGSTTGAIPVQISGWFYTISLQCIRCVVPQALFPIQLRSGLRDRMKSKTDGERGANPSKKKREIPPPIDADL